MTLHDIQSDNYIKPKLNISPRDFVIFYGQPNKTDYAILNFFLFKCKSER